MDHGARWWKVGCLALCLLLGVSGAFSAEAEPQPDLCYLNEKFLIRLPFDSLHNLYQTERRGWMGDGIAYSVWQCQGAAALLCELPWRYERAFQQDLFTMVTETLKPPSRYLPLLNQQKAYCYHVWSKLPQLPRLYSGQANELVDYYDRELLLIYAPQITLGDRQHHRNLLFVVELYR